MVLPVGQTQRGADADPHRQDRARARLHRPRRRPLRSPCRRGGAGRIGLTRAARYGSDAMSEAQRRRSTRAAPRCLVAARRRPRARRPAAGCQQSRSAPTAPSAEPAAPAVPNPAPDSRGVITYATYQVAVARDGDTIATVAARVGTTPADARPPQRAARGLHPAPRRGAAPARQRAAARPASTAARSRPSRSAGPPSRLGRDRRPAAAAPPPANPFQNGQTEPLIDPVRHRVEAGETAYSIARLYGVSVTALASWNGLGPDLAVRENQELLIPIVSDANRISSRRIDTQPGQGTPVAPPPSAAAPLPGRHHRRGRARLAQPRPVPHPAGRPAQRRRSRGASPAATTPPTRTASASTCRPAPRSTPPPPARWRWSPRRWAASAPSCWSATRTT